VAESQGGLIGNDMVVVSGFSTGWNYTTPKVYAYDTSVRGAQWREMDNIPVPEGLTHTGHVVVNCTKLYMCGGYVGNYTPYNPVPTSDCYQYNHKATAGTQWQKLPSLPGPRAGGSMHYDQNKNSLTFACGASRSDVKNASTTVDHNDVWELSLDNLAAGWQTKAPIPYMANHVGFTSVLYNGVQRHYTLGGQDRTDEPYGNKDSVFQYDSDKDLWTAVASMPYPRGHFASSTVSDNDGWGFFIVGGAVNGKKSMADLHYYSIGEDKWYKIGELPSARNTPVCIMGPDNYLYCQGGNIAFKFSWRMQLA
jgi:N-acetylneuraminic acid mutarotase